MGVSRRGSRELKLSRDLSDECNKHKPQEVTFPSFLIPFFLKCQVLGHEAYQ